MKTILDLQNKLQSLGIEFGPMDGIWGPQTLEGIRKAIVAGQINPNSDLEFLKIELVRRRPTIATMERNAGHLELDEQGKLKNKTEFSNSHLVTISIPMITGTKLKLTVNKIMAAPLTLAFAEIEYQNSLKPWQKWLPKRIESFCVRRMSSNKKVMSTHSWAMGFDADADENKTFEVKASPKIDMITNIPVWVVELFERWGFIWGGRWKSYKDPMHFQFVAMK